jgi:hypothetical protein
MGFGWILIKLPQPYNNLPNGDNGNTSVNIGEQAYIEKGTGCFTTKTGAVLFTYNGIIDNSYAITEWWRTVAYIPITQNSFNVQTANGNFTITNIKLGTNNSMNFDWEKVK